MQPLESVVIQHLGTPWTLYVGQDTIPRIRDLDWAERLGYERPRNIRNLIKRLVADGRLGEVFCFTVKQNTSSDGLDRGRPAAEFYLTEGQALKLAAKSETEFADTLLDAMIAVFMMVRHGHLQVAGATATALPSPDERTLIKPDPVTMLAASEAVRGRQRSVWLASRQAASLLGLSPEGFEAELRQNSALKRLEFQGAYPIWELYETYKALTAPMHLTYAPSHGLEDALKALSAIAKNRDNRTFSASQILAEAESRTSLGLRLRTALEACLPRLEGNIGARDVQQLLRDNKFRPIGKYQLIKVSANGWMVSGATEERRRYRS